MIKSQSNATFIGYGLVCPKRFVIVTEGMFTKVYEGILFYSFYMCGVWFSNLWNGYGSTTVTLKYGETV